MAAHPRYNYFWSRARHARAGTLAAGATDG